MSTQPCPKCNKPLKVQEVKKEGQNQGKSFISCKCVGGKGFFAWVDPEVPPAKKQYRSQQPVPQPPGPNTMSKQLSDIFTVLQELRESHRDLHSRLGAIEDNMVLPPLDPDMAHCDPDMEQGAQ